MDQQFYYLLYTTLKANTPIDTGNMYNNISLEDMGDHWKITVSAPTDFGDYARAVNYNQQRSPKEIRNYKWVERTIRQVSEVIGEVKYELS